MMTDLPLDQVRTLLAVVDEQSFDAAAAVLHVTPSAVSQRIKSLEQRTGRVLLLRTKPIQLTSSGQVLIRFARSLAQLEQDALAELGLGSSVRTLSIAVNADSLATWFLPALAKVPDSICFDLQREDQDHTAALLREGLVMAAVTASPHPIQGCTSTRLGRMRYRAMASPAFISRWLSNAPLPSSLPTAPVIVFDRKDDLQDRFLRSLTRRRSFTLVRHHIPASESFVDAVAAGLGWGMVPELQSADRGDSLVDLAPDRPLDVPLHWQQWKLDSPALAAVADAVAQGAKESLR
ncbi:LysR family transcriptional regulator ArgP [Amycolatopsis sp. SID8362]|uniref:LysR family transcriptional regulator ArgP n=1 Tax=Amycolatopsis sp. SID8362 TaxID=2690346 RepID=UPI00136F37E5|nr:LysR family transcriptional regulator ArgP [Amycolatopsis sp. SID8362]NBH06911.1 ArgP/LysG family DNA-binding transcriptional regulator [Amycolatopsis sp. SID8362]NED43608.1 LysR family transcriptional regulator ArgP [Amycolatopsis sp. SID8362]